jgi:membrane-bound ClpP family serine protease
MIRKFYVPLQESLLMEIIGIILLILIGLAAVILEILVIPGFVVGLIGILMIIGGVMTSYYAFGSIGGNITLGATILLMAFTLIFSLRAKTWKRLTLHTVLDGKVNLVAENITVGEIGTTISRLIPSGKARFKNGDFEVHSLNDFIDVNQEIKVIKTEGYKIIVTLNI